MRTETIERQRQGFELQRQGFDLALDVVMDRRDELFKILASEIPAVDRPLSQEWHKANKAHAAICELLPLLWVARSEMGK